MKVFRFFAADGRKFGYAKRDWLLFGLIIPGGYDIISNRRVRKTADSLAARNCRGAEERSCKTERYDEWIAACALTCAKRMFYVWAKILADTKEEEESC